MEPDFTTHSYIAYTYLGLTLELKALKSAAGWYIGSSSDKGPCSRDSLGYYPSVYVARAALTACSWTQRQNP